MCRFPLCPAPLLPSSPDQLLLLRSFPCPWAQQSQAPAGSCLQPGKPGAAGTKQALPGKGRCKSRGFHMKRSCSE